MKIHTQDFKDKIKELGREFDSVITYELNSETIELGNEELNSITPHYEGAILKSVMKQLDIDSNVDIPLGTEVNYQLGIKIDNDYEYLDYGNYIVFSSEKQEDTNSYKIIAYDKMLYSMKSYEALTDTLGDTITYPITLRDYLIALARRLNLTFKNASDTFVNYDKEIKSERYLTEDGGSLNYTYRDVLDELSQATASSICISDDDELEIRYQNITDTNEFEIEGNTTQDGTPTPDNLVPIINKTGIIEEEINDELRTINIGDIELCKIGSYKDKIKKGKGKNLLNVNSGYNKLDFTPSSMGVTSVIGTLHLEAGTTYYFTYTISNATTSSARNTPCLRISTSGSWSDFKFEKTINNYNLTAGRKKWQFEVDTTGDYNVYYWCQEPSNNVSISDFMISTNSNIEYEPYGYGGKWYKYSEIGKVVLDGSEIWNFSSSTNVFYGDISGLNYLTSNNIPKCNYYQGRSNVSGTGDLSNNQIAFLNSASPSRIYIKDTSQSSANDFKTWLTTHNAIVYYVLATSTYELITNQDTISSLNDTGLDEIDEEYLKDVNVKFGEKFGPINALTLARSSDSDIIDRTDDESIQENGLCEIRISDNQILNDDDRDLFIDGIFNQLKGLEYYVNDYSSTGICYYDFLDRYNVKVDDKFYSCLMLNDEIEVSQGLIENIHAEAMEQQETDYTKSSKTDKLERRTGIIVDKQNGTIDLFVERVNTLEDDYDDLDGKVADLGTRMSIAEGGVAIAVSVQEQLETGVELVKTGIVTIDENGIDVGNTSSKVHTKMTNNEFSVGSENSSEKFCYIGYDGNASKGEIDNLYVRHWLSAGVHRTETFEVNGETRTGVFYEGRRQ